MISIVVRNESNLLNAADLGANIAAVQAQISTEFKSAWNIDADLIAAPTGTTTEAKGAYNVVFKDTSDVEGDLGYHLDDKGIPTAYVFMQDCVENGDLTGSICFSHEVLEMLVDPTINKQANSGSGIWSYEVADPVEGNSYKAANGVP